MSRVTRSRHARARYGGDRGTGASSGRIQVQDPPIEEDDSIQGLVLGAAGQLAPDGEIAQKGLDLRGAHLARVPPDAVAGMEADEPLDPVDIGLLGAPGVVAQPDHPAHFVHRLANHDLRIIRGINSAGVPIAAGVLYPFFGVLLSPMIAAAAMTFSGVSVIGNALRLRQVSL